jgi:hypothetical protein
MNRTVAALVLSTILLTVAVMLAPDRASGAVTPPLRMLITKPGADQAPLFNVRLKVGVWRGDQPIGTTLIRYTNFDGTCVFTEFGSNVLPKDVVKLMVDGPSGCSPFEIPLVQSQERESEWVLSGAGGEDLGSCGVTKVTIGGDQYWRACPLCPLSGGH